MADQRTRLSITVALRTAADRLSSIFPNNPTPEMSSSPTFVTETLGTFPDEETEKDDKFPDDQPEATNEEEPVNDPSCVEEANLIYWNDSQVSPPRSSLGVSSSEEDVTEGIARAGLQQRPPDPPPRMKKPSLEKGPATVSTTTTPLDGKALKGKESVARVVEQCMKKLAADGIITLTSDGEVQQCPYGGGTLRSRFLATWLIIKIVQAMISGLTAMTFHHEGSFGREPEAFLPVLVTFYVTFLNIAFTMLLHVACSNFPVTKNPHTLLYLITSGILTVIVSTGTLILLGIIGYYGSGLQALVFFLAIALEASLLIELVLCYLELRRLWNRIGQNETRPHEAT